MYYTCISNRLFSFQIKMDGLEDQLRIAVDHLGDAAGLGTPGQSVFQAVKEASALVSVTREDVLAECKSSHGNTTHRFLKPNPTPRQSGGRCS